MTPVQPTPANPEQQMSRCTIYDAGRPIGQVVDPRSEPVTGRGQGTVLLKR